MFKYKDQNGNWIELPELKGGKIQEENMPEVLPPVTPADEGKVLKVVNGKWEAVEP